MQNVDAVRCSLLAEMQIGRGRVHPLTQTGKLGLHDEQGTIAEVVCSHAIYKRV